MPSDYSGAGIPAASRIVGTMSITWWNWLRMPPSSLMRAGQEMTAPLRTPPRYEAICFTHLYGVSKAKLQATAMCV
jgi:hypothetical protein